MSLPLSTNVSPAIGGGGPVVTGSDSRIVSDGRVARLVPGITPGGVAIPSEVEFEEFLKSSGLPLFVDQAIGTPRLSSEVGRVEGGISDHHSTETTAINASSGLQVVKQIERSVSTDGVLAVGDSLHEADSSDDSGNNSQHSVAYAFRDRTEWGNEPSVLDLKAAVPVPFAESNSEIGNHAAPEPTDKSPPDVPTDHLPRTEFTGSTDALRLIQGQPTVAHASGLSTAMAELPNVRTQGLPADATPIHHAPEANGEPGLPRITTPSTNPPLPESPNSDQQPDPRGLKGDSEFQALNRSVDQRQSVIPVDTDRLRQTPVPPNGNNFHDASFGLDVDPTTGQATQAIVTSPNVRVTNEPIGSSPAISHELAGTVAEYVTKPSRDGTRTFEMRLDPPELGKVWVRLTDSRHGLSAKIVVASDAAMTAIESQLPSLRSSLENAGVMLREFNLSQDPGQQFQHSNNSYDTPMADSMDGPDRDDRDSPWRLGNTVLAVKQGRVDLLV